MKRNDEEHKIQSGIIKAVEMIPECRWLHAIPNGGKRGVITGARMKNEGVKPGIPDLFLPLRRPRPNSNPIWYAGLYIEVKARLGDLTAEQSEYLKYANEQGYKAVVVRSTQSGVDEILNYINGGF